MENSNEIITLGGGCFWCLEAVFAELQGVTQVVSGYAGGSVPSPSYEQVCNETTGHAEVVQVTFDPEIISSKEILSIFFSIHDPTTLNRQGADVGSQYRSAIIYHSARQEEIAQALIADLNESHIWPDPIVTEVVPLDTFYQAEDYHQEYFKYNSQQPYCQVVVAPKLAKFRKQFAHRRKEA
jgi:peptide-methionine (S)-S-oxide reductase